MIDIKVLKDHIYDVIGAIHEVKKGMGPGLNEYCYQEALQMQLDIEKIPYVREKSFHPSYNGNLLKTEFRVDFLCKNDIIIECKSVTELINIHRAQLHNYLRLTKSTCGILVNFFPDYFEIERYFYDDERKTIIGYDGRTIKGYKQLPSNNICIFSNNLNNRKTTETNKYFVVLVVNMLLLLFDETLFDKK